jgi:spore coat protein A, manganese oxidase
MTTRREFLARSASAGAGLFLVSRAGVLAAPGATGLLPPRRVPKFVTPLVIPPAMPATSTDGAFDFYRIAVRPFAQQILPAPLPATPVFGFGSADYAGTFNAPSFTIEAGVDRPVRVEWRNELVNPTGRYIAHLLPVDQTLHWANPPGGIGGRDMRGTSQLPYTGPVPWVTHVHGAHAREESDGYTEAWFLPNAINIPAGYATVGSWYDTFKSRFQARYGVAWQPGTATFHYDNDQRAATLWYHDHVLGMTRLNVYAGAAGFFILRGGADDLAPGVLPGPAPQRGDAPGTPYYEIPLAIQDRSFYADGSLFYPDARAFFEELRPGQLQIPFAGDPACDGTSDVAPIWNPEFFGTTMMVNGRTWPYLTVEQRRYRFRLLNGCNSRFLVLAFDRPGLRFWQVGAEGGFLDAPVERTQVLMAPAERADVVVDFTQVPIGTRIVLLNLGPDEPFGGGEPDEDFDRADPSQTGLVMQFRVVAATSLDTSIPPSQLALPPRVPLPDATNERHVALLEEMSHTVRVVTRPSGVVQLACNNPDAEPFGPTEALLGTVVSGVPQALGWMDPVTETPVEGETELWHIHNHTEDAHPIHIHELMFEVAGRTDAQGSVRPPEAWERGTKDTVIAYPSEVTTVKARFDLPGRFVWHCHIVEHEDNEMMRPLEVIPAP